MLDFHCWWPNLKHIGSPEILINRSFLRSLQFSTNILQTICLADILRKMIAHLFQRFIIQR